MNKLKTAIIVISIIVTLALGFFFLPGEELVYKLPYLNQLYNNTKLVVGSRNGKAEVSVNGKSYGTTPTTISDLIPGTYSITLERVTDTSQAYSERTFEIDLTRNTEAVIDIEIGPEDISSGYVLYYTKTPGRNSDGYISITSDVDSTSVYLDEDYLSTTPINSMKLKPKDYQLKLISNGYEELSFPVIVSEGYNLNVQTYLFPIPLTIDEKVNE